MEWVETTAKTLDEAREAALDQLGVGADDAEFDILEEPKPGLFGRVRGEARIRARIRPTQARPKQERKRRSRSDKTASSDGPPARPNGERADAPARPSQPTTLDRSADADTDARRRSSRDGGRRRIVPAPSRQRSSKQREQVPAVSHEDARCNPTSPPTRSAPPP